MGVLILPVSNILSVNNIIFCFIKRANRRTLLQRLWLLADTAFDGNVRCADGAA